VDTIRQTNRPGFGHGNRKGRRGEKLFAGWDYTTEEVFWLRAISNFQTCWGPIKSWPIVLKIAHKLGYRK
jgi:hypothetical protein